MINFIHCETKTSFESRLADNTITSDDLVFIKNTGEIWTHNKYYTSIDSLLQDFAELEQYIDQLAIDISNKTDKSETEFLSNIVDSKADISDLSNVVAEQVTDVERDELNILTREEAKKDLFIDLWNDACGSYGKYNHSTGFFELNGLTDLTYKEALDIYNVSAGANLSAKDSLKGGTTFKYFTGRTLIPVKYTSLWPDISEVYQNCENIEVINVVQKASTYTGSSDYIAFSMCKKLKTIMTELYSFIDKTSFKECSALENIKIRPASNLNLQWSPLLTFDSVNHLLKYAMNTKAITVTLHPDIYAKITDETNPNYEQWHQLLALAESKNISLATI